MDQIKQTKFHIVVCITRQQIFPGWHLLMQTYWLSAFLFFIFFFYFKPSPEITRAKAMDTDIMTQVCKMQLVFQEVDFAGISEDEIKALLLSMPLLSP